MTKTDETMAACDNSTASYLENYGRATAEIITEVPHAEVFNIYAGGSPLSRLRAFQNGLNEILKKEGYPTLELVSPVPARPKQLSLSERIVFHWRRFWHLRR